MGSQREALLPFPSVLGMMAADMGWTTDLGNAFLAQQQSVMDAVQSERHKAAQYGYLRSNDQVVVGMGPYITISPVNPGYVVVPAYDPALVFYAPRPGFFIGGGIHWGFGITIGGFFVRGAGVTSGSIGDATSYFSTTRLGDGAGITVACTFTHMRVFIATVDRDMCGPQSTTNCIRSRHASGDTPGKVGAAPKNITKAAMTGARASAGGIKPS